MPVEVVSGPVSEPAPGQATIEIALCNGHRVSVTGRDAASRRERDGRPRRPEHRPERLGRANATGYDARQSRVLLAERGDTTLRGARSLFPRAVPVSRPCKGGVVGGRQRQRSTRGDTRKRERPSRARHEVAGRTAARAQDRGEWPEHHAATGNGAARATTRRGDRPHGEISIPPGRGVYPSWRPPARRLANRRRLVLVRRRPIRVPRREGSVRPAAGSRSRPRCRRCAALRGVRRGPLPMDRLLACAPSLSPHRRILFLSCRC